MGALPAGSANRSRILHRQGAGGRGKILLEELRQGLPLDQTRRRPTAGVRSNPPELEPQLQRKLDNPRRVQGGADLSARGAVDVRRRCGERGMIQKIEQLAPELELPRLRDREQ